MRSDQTTEVHDPPAGLVFVCICEAGTFVRAVDPTRALVFGRGEDCDVVLEDGSVSRKHAAIGGTPLRAEDLGSRNGSRVFGARLEAGKPVELPIGASIELGRAVVLVQRGEVPTPKPLPPTFIARDPRMQRVVRLAEVVATRPGNILIVGEPGSGKETLARFIHERSGAVSPLVFVEALDRLPLERQRELASAGGRIISSASANAAETIPADVLRSLASVILTIPPLRERVADIEPLAHLFARGKELTRSAIARLEAHAWPTNVSGLASAIDAARASDRIDEADLEALGIGASLPAGALHEAVEDLERRRILDALSATNGNQSAAAKKLGIARGTLIARLEVYGIARPRKK